VTGEVDDYGRALIRIIVKAGPGASVADLTVWVDTAFTGELVMPRETIARMRLPKSSAVIADLADGTDAVLDTYTCRIVWFGVELVVEVVESDAKLPLLGVGLLKDHRLVVDYPLRQITID
jgi:clan AA aspartic protease